MIAHAQPLTNIAGRQHATDIPRPVYPPNTVRGELDNLHQQLQELRSQINLLHTDLQPILSQQPASTAPTNPSTSGAGLVAAADAEAVSEIQRAAACTVSIAAQIADIRALLRI